MEGLRVCEEDFRTLCIVIFGFLSSRRKPCEIAGGLGNEHVRERSTNREYPANCLTSEPYRNVFAGTKNLLHGSWRHYVKAHRRVAPLQTQTDQTKSLLLRKIIHFPDNYTIDISYTRLSRPKSYHIHPQLRVTGPTREDEWVLLYLCSETIEHCRAS